MSYFFKMEKKECYKDKLSIKDQKLKKNIKKKKLKIVQIILIFKLNLFNKT